jgi:hypothetical protein
MLSGLARPFFFPSFTSILIFFSTPFFGISFYSGVDQPVEGNNWGNGFLQHD